MASNVKGSDTTGMAAPVKGFRFQPVQSYLRALSAASESPSGRNPRGAVWAVAVYGDFTRWRLLDAVRAPQDNGTAPPGVDDPGIASEARSGDLIAPEGQPWLKACVRTLGEALHPVMAFAAE